MTWRENRRPDRERRLASSADPAKNLAAARFFHWHLDAEQAKGFNAREEPQRFYMGACVNFACGAVEALSMSIGVKDAGLDEGWRSRQHRSDLALFDRLWEVRIEDFHFGVLDAQAGHKWVDAPRDGRNVTLFSSSHDSMVEVTNADGEIVRGHILMNVPHSTSSTVVSSLAPRRRVADSLLSSRAFSIQRRR